ncbi:putative disease resistance protein RGA4 isoform X2 [Phragmites australis]|uniref:putative disease resistance protein RGA4 isoform X2 n=1 Tax=Phragmites australis TaxID=29695 RepID=UPI002D79D102|nr:putative disease resistance protein RGA4 isoform X2 [Phragmites australis]XP_062181737.1 putative disease resistance protein RGA4 isoform X2 [Phragmites australis]XP_062181738.1 putative disease resistance protein RGA4 isoform X2 [Phragmites australis]
MAVVLEALASYIQNMLMEMTKEEVYMLLGVSGEINKMDIKLKDLKNFLTDADRRNITDLSVQAWVKELRETMYDATDILDLCQLKAMERGPSRDLGCFNPLLFFMRNPLHAHDIGSRIKSLNQRLEEIKKRSSDFGFINLGSYEDHTRKMPSSHPTSHETSGELDESGVVGEKIIEDTRYLVEMLTKEEETNREYNKIMVFAIVGVGGIGKTTLAQKIFNDDIIQHEFTKKIWLSVNQEFDENKLLRTAILESGGGNQPVDYPKSALERILKQALEGHKTLLVMDDVWDHQVWQGVLETPLVNALARGSRVLITTRHDMVARGMKAEEPYHHVDKLEPEDAWSLLKMQVVKHEIDKCEIDMLKDIGMSIIENCGCLPLAVKVMGGLLRQKKQTRRAVWEKAAKDSKWSVSKMPEQLNNAIYLSYKDLHPYLKQCFLHYSLIPRGLSIHVDSLVSMWISEGFVHGDTDELEDLGREYYDELISRNLIDPDSRSVDQWRSSMHDVVRSFAQYVARDEALVGHLGEINMISKLNSQKFIRLSNERSETNGLEWSSLQAQKSLRTIISIGQLKINPRDSFVSFSSLRTLFVLFAHCDALLESLYQLKHLRYLCMRECGISTLPENIGMMKLLLHIDISRNESLVKLPGSIVKLRLLRHLSLDGTRINKIPNGFKVLDNLRHLNGFPAHMDGEWCSLEELGPLCQLNVLVIICLENVSASSFAEKARLAEKVRLRCLTLKCTTRLGDDGRLVKKEEGVSMEEQQRIEEVFDELCPSPCLEILGIEGYYGRRLPRWMTSTAVAPFERLRTVMMYDLACCTELPHGLCQLPCLEILQIIRAPAIKRVGPEFLQLYHHRHNHSQVAPVFPRLQELNFGEMVEWEEWEWEEQVHAMPALQRFHLHNSKLRQLPPGLAFHARALTKLYLHHVQHLSSLENFASVVDLHVERNLDLERISNFPKLRKLDIMFCPKMKVLQGVPALQRLGLDDNIMEALPRYLKNVNPMNLLLCCSLSLLTFIASRESSLEWDKLIHIQQVKAYAPDGDIARKWYVLYTREPFSFETNISLSAITQACTERKWFGCFRTCSIEEMHIVELLQGKCSRRCKCRHRN